jgi:predicted helicase
MSKTRIEQYYREVEEAIQSGGSDKESAIRRYFANLIDFYAKPKKLTLIDERGYKNTHGKLKYPDGSLLLSGSPLGHWESKDTKDDLEAEIEKKFAIGYPQYNILFENSEKAVLFQAPTRYVEGEKVREANIKNWKELHEILSQFVGYETEEIRQFREALGKFTESVPPISKILKAVISISAGNSKIEDYDTATQIQIREAKQNPEFTEKRRLFWEFTKQSLNPNIVLQDIDEMVIQHILTSSIFNTIFGEAQFHRENNISKEIENIVESFFYEDLRRNTTDKLKDYYEIIVGEARQMKVHREKQRFLKLIYEEFYKAYNPDGADRLGIVYTPSEIVQFMLKATDFLLDKHFDRTLNDLGVKILDPCTGTGTFVCDLIEYLNLQNLEKKYEQDIFANELSILPYYIANLNIEYTYKEKVGRSKSFKNLAFVDTLDNLEGMAAGHLGESAEAIYGTTGDLFAISQENVRRIKTQNEQNLMVIMGNPPYNSSQQNYNQYNPNRFYTKIDQRIKKTYVQESKAQHKGDLYDMYVRFLRWASDRIGKNGIVSFVMNRSFIDSIAFDGLRKCFAKDFQEIWILDTKSDVRANPKIAGTTHNVFGIQTGVCTAFLLRNEEKIQDQERSKLYYFSLEDEMRKDDKLWFLATNRFKDVPFERIRPDQKGNWLNQTDNDFDTFIPLIDKEVKNGKSQKAIFELFSLGVATHRDAWVYDFSKKNVEQKVRFLIDIYQKSVENNDFEKKKIIAWDADLEKYRQRGIKKKFEKQNILKTFFRPFTQKYLYFDKHLNGRNYQWRNIFSVTEANPHISFSGIGHNKPFAALALQGICDLGFMECGQNSPLYRYENGERKENISDWALSVFRKKYSSAMVEDLADALVKGKRLAESSTTANVIQKLDIFHYVYAVLHNPAYRQKYEQNLKRDFPRIPLYEDFWAWASWGKELMELHLNYETIEPFPLIREDKALKVSLLGLKTKLKADKVAGVIALDEQTDLVNIPPEAWEYKIGNRSALEWILDQYKESKPSDPTVLEKFNTYRFPDYKEEVIELLRKICTVSVETMRIIKEMQVLSASAEK